MAYNIEILPSHITFTSENTLLEDILVQSVPLEHSCKSGDCGICEEELISDVVENEDGEHGITGKILTCCSKPCSVLTLNDHYYPELVDIKFQTFPCKVETKDFPAHDIAVLKLRLTPMANCNYLPSQYIGLNYKRTIRSYSIANAQTVLTGVALHIRHLPQGAMFVLVFSVVKSKQLIWIKGPRDKFFPHSGNKLLISFAGGTGFSPPKAMIEGLLAQQDKRAIIVCWEVIHKETFYSDIVQHWTTGHEHINYTPVLSQHDPSWLGRLGYVHQSIVDYFDS
jgi:CDP-4-dehydro-6-deoxyglucose reductase